MGWHSTTDQAEGTILINYAQKFKYLEKSGSRIALGFIRSVIQPCNQGMGILIIFFLLSLMCSVQTNYPHTQRMGALAHSVKYRFKNIQPK